MSNELDRKWVTAALTLPDPREIHTCSSQTNRNRSESEKNIYIYIQMFIDGHAER
jgi:hypothetical protein